jgi:hypothetical protein
MMEVDKWLEYVLLQNVFAKAITSLSTVYTLALEFGIWVV